MLSGLSSWAAGFPRLFIGALSFQNNGSGFVDPDTFATLVQANRGSAGSRFGGVCMWEGTDALITKNSAGKNFIDVTKQALTSGAVSKVGTSSVSRASSMLTKTHASSSLRTSSSSRVRSSSSTPKASPSTLSTRRSSSSTASPMASAKAVSALL